jgi:phenol hydroxylase P0 protein
MNRAVFDVTRKFVRVTELRSDGFVEFEFAIGEPELFVEMILPPAAFDEFCAMNAVTFINEKDRFTFDGSKGDTAWTVSPSKVRLRVSEEVGNPEAAK